MRQSTHLALAALLLVTASAASGCTADSPASPTPSSTTSGERSVDPSDGDPATWTLVDPSAVDARSTEVRIAVTRISCSGGETGDLLAPTVIYEDDRVVIHAIAAPLPEGAYTCLGNDAVDVTVELDEPLGERDLIDGVCLEGAAVSTVFCAEGPVRHAAPET